MTCLLKPTTKPWTPFIPITHTGKSPPPPPPPSLLHFHPPFSSSSHPQNPRRRATPCNINSSTWPNKTHLLKPLLRPTQKPLLQVSPPKKSGSCNSGHVGSQQQIWVLCGVGYWVQGFRCFPWLALNFHMVHGLGLSPSTLQLVQSCANLPMVAKPLYGLLSDALYIGGGHRLPYISFGVFLQVMSWGTLALITVTGDTFPTQMAFILLGNLGASFSEVVSDALVAEFSKTQKAGLLQSYAFMALAAGGILGNLSGGFFLLKTQQPKAMLFTFALLLTIQLALSLSTREDSLQTPRNSSYHLIKSSVSGSLSKQFSDMITAINKENIFYPLSWIMASIAVVPLLSGTLFCFQTQCLKLDPSVIGLSKVVGQLMVLSATVVYNRYLKRIPLRKLIFWVQISYALALLSDLFLVKQFNLKLGISNEAYVLCLSALAEAVAQFKILPFSVLFASLCPPGCEGSLFAFFASALCLSSILSGVFGVGLASLIGVSSGDYSGLPLGIVLQFIAALVPLGWISHLPIMQTTEKVIRRGKKSFIVG